MLLSFTVFTFLTVNCNHIKIHRDLYCVSNNTVKFGLGWVNKYGPMSMSEVAAAAAVASITKNLRNSGIIASSASGNDSSQLVMLPGNGSCAGT